ncbi:extensin family protein, partial [Pseudomonas viridiflava]|uniref:extensin-like domain-containing protein n=1 Tax=Pseudomonas viridiflava TaxID=33069 RepID=UPI000F0427E3
VLPQWNPWAPLDVRAEPNLLTPFKLSRLRDDPALCDQVLSASGLRFSRQADSPASARCPLENTLRVQGGDVALSSSFLASCPLAVAFALFERHSLQPAAQAVYGQAVTRVDHLGSFACRNMYNRAEGRLSQHASANALDIAGFRLADGRSIS